MSRAERILSGPISLLLRALPAPLVVSLVFLLWMILGYIFEGIGVPLERIGATRPSSLSWSVVWEILAKTWDVFLIVLLGSVLLEALLSLFSDKLYNGKTWLLKTVGPPSLVIDHLKNTTTISVTELDDFIRGIYARSRGPIVLYNPDPTLFACADSPVRQAVLKKLGDGSVTKLKIEVSSKDVPSFAHFLEEAEAMGVNDLIQIWPDAALDEHGVKHIERRAVYFASAGVGVFDVYYFMYRPIRWPYNDQYVIIKRGKDLRGMRYETRDLYAAVTECDAPK